MCSFSYASCCPEAVWLQDLYSQPISITMPQTAVYVGCNKALDAVNTLRMLSHQTEYDKATWRKALFGHQQVPTGSCGQERDEQFQIPRDDENNNNGHGVVVHCIEALPANAQRLEQTAQQLGWQDALLVRNVAIGPVDAAENATMLFPDATHHLVKGNFGVETANAKNCEGKRVREHCAPVPLLSLDRYIQQQVLNNMDSNTDSSSTSSTTVIDFLSIDIEGLDWTVLQGATMLTTHVRYLEFEYNHKGPWWKQNLRDAIDHLQTMGFVCYWPGVGGNIWRITGCWLDHYDYHFWSNVACGNQVLGAPVLERMEARFRTTLAAGDAIQYNHLATAKTDGRSFPINPTYPADKKKQE